MALSKDSTNACICLVFSIVLIGIGLLIGYFSFSPDSSSENNIIRVTTCPDISASYFDTAAPRDGFQTCLEGAVADSERGYAVFPWSDEYYNASQVFSKFYQSYPVAIIFADSEQVVMAVSACAYQYGVPITPRCGGHGNAGNSVSTGAVTIDLSLMTKVVILPGNKTATVQAGNTAGTSAYELMRQSNGTLAIPIGQKPTVGISGLTLGGGFGFSTRLVGLLCDNLVAIRAVTSSGDLVVANSTYNSDLLWASCGGGGGSFVTVTEFEFKLFNVARNVTEIHYPIGLLNKTSAQLAIVHYQNVSYSFDANVTANLEVVNASMMSISGFYAGTESDFYNSLEIADPNGYFPADNWVIESKSYIEAVLDLSGWDTDRPESLRAHFLQERNYYQFKSFLLSEPLPIEGIAMIIDGVILSGEVGLVFEFQSLGGADSFFSLVGDEDTAVSHRNTRHCMMLKAWGPDLSQGEFMFGRMSNLSYALASHITGQGAYVNHMDYELWNFRRAYYGLPDEANWNRTIQRLQAVSDKYDPTNNLYDLQLF